MMHNLTLQDFNKIQSALNFLEEARSKADAISKEVGAISLDLNNHEGNVHMNETGFFANFSTFEVVDRYPGQTGQLFPHRFETTVNGIKFFCIGNVKNVSMKFIMDEVMREVAVNE